MDEVMSAMMFVGNLVLIALAWVMTYTGLPAEPAAILGTLMAIDFIVGISKAQIGRAHV